MVAVQAKERSKKHENRVSRYPVYIISKGRFDNCLTAQYFLEDKVEFKLVVEPREYEDYAKHFDKDLLLKLPENMSDKKLGGFPTRNWVWEHAKANKHKRHWIFDDNIRGVSRWYNNKRIRCNANYGIKAIEEFVDRYTNIAIAGFNYTMFAHQSGLKPKMPFWLNVHVYSALLIDNELPFRWRLKYNEDVDLCLQALTNNYCTVSFNAFTVNKIRTMTMKGGNTDSIYKDKGIVNKTMSLQKMWPFHVKIVHKFKRIHHSVNWKQFKQPLIRRADFDFTSLAKIDNYGMKLKEL